jgi:RNA polymerase sigma factor (sigma-70 family)
MAEVHRNPFVHHIRHLIGCASDAALTDGQLLDRFFADRDETAVEVLVRRYGPLVYGVCRRVLHNTHAAEDVFQATFLVLVRKIPSLDRGKPLGNWLYTVAYRLALTARASELRRQRCEAQAARQRSSIGGSALSASELVVAVEEELHRLPQRHRAPLVLCYLEGKTNDQAAAILGCPRGSMAARLAQAKERLRERLVRRGFAAPAVSITAVLVGAAARGAVPLPLLNSTLSAIQWFAREETCAASVVSARAVALARGALRTMFLNKLKIGAALLLVALMLGTGATMLLKAAPQPDSLAQATGRPTPEARTKRGEDPRAAPDRGGNAALPYGQAFIALRRGGDPEKLRKECLTMPLDAHAREIVTRAAYALRMLHRGAAQQRCDWAIDLEQGIENSFTRADGGQVLSSLACLRARLRFEEGQSAEAIEDIVAALTLARHVSRDGTLDSLRAGYHIEYLMGETLALYLPRLDARITRELQMRVRTLPPGGSVATATMHMEASLLDWIVGEVQEAKDNESLLAFLSQLGHGPREPEKRRAEGRAILQECGGTAEGVLRYADQMRRSYTSMAKTLDLPPDQVATQFEREERKLAGNPVFKVFAPVLHNVRQRQAEAEVRRGLLLAALAVKLDGVDALKKHPDPVLGGPFEYVAFEGGFVLRSKLKGRDDKPLTLTVGRRGK